MRLRKATIFAHSLAKRLLSTNQWILKFPELADSREAVVERWLVRDGEHFKAGDSLCEVTLKPAEIMVGVSEPKGGIVAKVYVPVGKRCGVHEPIALLVADQAEYNMFLDDIRRNANEDEKLAAVTEVIKESHHKPDIKSLLRQLKQLIQQGDIVEDSGQ